MVILKLKLGPISETLQVWCDGMTLGAGDGHLSRSISKVYANGVQVVIIQSMYMNLT